ncbi:MAG TPA: HAMP domain-containing sensor histidine kinase [Gaiellales bacterium]|nr:HAMP domain-containing sensor histidine kinase [Gaiellales bacterium]
MTAGGRTGGRIGAAVQGVSLRARLLLVLAVLLAAGLVVADIATYAALRSSLFKRVDSSLQSSANGVASSLDQFDRQGPGPGGPLRRINVLAQFGVLTPGTYVEIRPGDGTPVIRGTLTRPGETAPAPRIPQGFGPRGDGSPRHATVSAVSGGSRFRLLAQAVPSSDSTLILGVPLHETDTTLSQLKWIEVLVACAVIASALLFALWLITASLRPLRRIEETAAAIGAGDLSRRVEPDGGTTEIGRLGGALNAMLGQIEDAFAERSASEARLRRFISDASHELRTPIAAVSAYAELFDRGARDRPADLERSMTGIQRETRRMGLLVGDLLLLARLDQGRPLEAKPLDLTKLAGEAADAARAMQPGRPLVLDAPAPVSVTGDAERLRQVADNLLANVRAHTPPDAAAVVRVRREGTNAVLEVEDRGPGLDAERGAHVFERFYRGDPSRSRDHGGAGLGLAIVAAIVQAHGGSVSLESMPGAGTTFRVTLPDRETLPEAVASSPPSAP